MADVDTSIYNNVAKPTNFLDQYGQMLDLQNKTQSNQLLGTQNLNALQQNKLMQIQNQQKQIDLQNQQMEFSGKQLLNDPQYIRPDGSKKYLDMMADPRFAGNTYLASAFPEAMNSAAAPQTVTYPSTKIPGSTESQTVSKQDATAAYLQANHPDLAPHYNNVRSMIDDTNDNIINNPNPTGKDLSNVVVNAVVSGDMNGKQAAQTLQKLTPAAGQPVDKMAVAQEIFPAVQAASKMEKQVSSLTASNNPLANTNLTTPLNSNAATANIANEKQGEDLLPALQQQNQDGIKLADSAKQALQTLGEGVQTGNYAPTIAKMKGALASIVGSDKVPKVTSDVAGLQILAKQLALVTKATGGQDATDLARLQTEAATTDPTKVPAAVRKVLLWAQGQGEMQKAPYNIVNSKLGANPKGVDVKNVVSKFGNADPAVYRYMLMNPQERKDFYQNLPAGQKESFKNNYKNMSDLGALDAVKQNAGQ